MIAACLVAGAIGGFVSKKLYNNPKTNLCLHVSTVGAAFAWSINGIAWYSFLNNNQIADLSNDTIPTPSQWTTIFLPFILGCIVDICVQLFVYKGQHIDGTFAGI